MAFVRNYSITRIILFYPYSVPDLKISVIAVEMAMNSISNYYTNKQTDTQIFH